MTLVSISIKGKTYTLSRKDVEEVFKRLEPEQLKGKAKYYIEFNGIRFPIKQVIAEVTGLPRLRCTPTTS